MVLKVQEDRPSTGLQFNFFLVRLALSFCGFIVVCNVYTMIPIIEDLAVQFQVSKVTLSWATSSFTLFYSIGFLAFGPLSDRWGRWQVIVYGLGALSIVTLAISFTESVYMIIILRALFKDLRFHFCSSST
ncbi:MFS transporter [Ammoniphilus sp. 3BR4]|uniref:MFS transporter n=1 Tax=Ammoniphilus sp. 3BR4 TaxID=3158265 RepID=UPI003465D7EA